MTSPRIERTSSNRLQVPNGSIAGTMLGRCIRLLCTSSSFLCSVTKDVTEIGSPVRRIWKSSSEIPFIKCANVSVSLMSGSAFLHCRTTLSIQFLIYSPASCALVSSLVLTVWHRSSELPFPVSRMRWHRVSQLKICFLWISNHILAVPCSERWHFPTW